MVCEFQLRQKTQSSIRGIAAMRTVIVGAGIAGLWVADRLVAAGTPGKSITILEKYDYDGGRIVTAPGGYEIGAGRVHESHVLTNALIDRFGLTRAAHNPAVDWRPLATLTSTPNHFEAAWRVITAVMPHSGRHTIRELVAGTSFEKLLDQYPYRAETERLRADLSIPAFRPSGEMGTREGYFSVREGLSAIVRGLTATLKDAGVRIRHGVEVTNVTHEDSHYEVHIKDRPIRAGRVILALHASALRRLPVMRDCEPLRHLTMAPLTRIYAEYPPSASTGAVWFAGMNRTVTDSPLRYIIPIDSSRGIVMISYTDDRDTAHWHGLKGPRLQAAIQAEVHRLWPALDIPEPTWIRPYEWHDGCTYWMPGDYDPIAESRRMLRPRPATMPELYVCGESFSVGRQAWIEGALEHAELLWNTHLKTVASPL
jgi:glycine/D-amino acid oxidase-like deaminating enzyme